MGLNFPVDPEGSDRTWPFTSTAQLLRPVGLVRPCCCLHGTSWLCHTFLNVRSMHWCAVGVS